MIRHAARPIASSTLTHWIGRFIMPGLFDGEHIFRLDPLDSGGTRFIQADRFSGLLVRAFVSTLDKTQLGFEQVNTALKARTEAAARS